MRVSLGQEVGFSIRFQDVYSARTRIKFLTDGTLLREFSAGKIAYDLIVIDEAHERSLRTDLLLGTVKILLSTPGNTTKVIIMSATLDAGIFSAFFNNCPVVQVQGRQFPVHVHSVLEPVQDLIQAVVKTVVQLHCSQGAGDVLVFLSGQEEIEAAAWALKAVEAFLPAAGSAEVSSSSPGPAAAPLPSTLPSPALGPASLPSSSPASQQAAFRPIKVLPLHAKLSQSQQAEVFRPFPQGRKIILATNVAETSITIPGVRFVIDSGIAKQRKFHHSGSSDSSGGIESLLPCAISKSSASQRAGRAGRESEGWCFRLYTAEEFQKMDTATEPEVLRSDLAYAYLQLLANPATKASWSKFPWIDAPPLAMQKAAITQLCGLGALDLAAGQLTEIGRKMARFPLDPKQARSVLAAAESQCLAGTIDVLSLLSVDQIWADTKEAREGINEKRLHFVSRLGDHMTALRVFKAYEEMRATDKASAREWCKQNFLMERNLVRAFDVRKSLQDACDRMKLKSWRNEQVSDKIEEREAYESLVLRALMMGNYQNLAIKQPDGTFKQALGGQAVKIHPGSVVTQRPSVLAIMYEELVLTTNVYARTVGVIEQGWLADLPIFSRRSA